jgi:hypothetical protein
MNKKFAMGALTAAFILGGCASPPQLPIAMNSAALHVQGTRVGVAMEVAKVDTVFPGAGCLLCLAAASVANQSLTAYTQKLPTDDIAHIKSDLSEQLRKRGYTPVLLPDDFKVDSLPKGADGPNKPKYDFSSLRGKYQIDELVYVQISQLGISRNYASYVPTGAPQATVLGHAYMVNLADNSFDWYATIKQERSATGAWDEAPNYPGLTNAYFQAVEGARDDVLKPFND